ncbi:MAG TPA: MBL fold metallo-hydrolase [Bryobacteraceae bacterium]|nr:MBL fold metallo-hydrolase [Bryobacteraceae bacterium]
MEIAPDIHMIEGIVGRRPLQLFLLSGEERTVLLDTGCAPDPERLVFPYLTKLGRNPDDIDLVINTHPDLDHCGGNFAMKAASPNVLLTCGEADRELIEDPAVMWERRYCAYAEPHGLEYDADAKRWMCEMLGQAQPVDWTWSGGETLRLGRDWVVKIHHTPGHSAGHISVFDPRNKVMLSGDAVQGSVYLDVDGKPALCPTYTRVDTYLATVRYFESLPIDKLLTCHWPVMTGSEVSEFLAETRRFVELAQELIVKELRAAPEGMTLRELITATGPKLGSWPREIDAELMYALAGNVEHLTASGAVVEVEGQRPKRYCLTSSEAV